MWIALLGMICWGIGMGAQESLLKSVIAALVVPRKRGTALGVFDTGFGIAWFAGSWLMGILLRQIDHSCNHLFRCLAAPVAPHFPLRKTNGTPIRLTPGLTHW